MSTKHGRQSSSSNASSTLNGSSKSTTPPPNKRPKTAPATSMSSQREPSSSTNRRPSTALDDGMRKTTVEKMMKELQKNKDHEKIAQVSSFGKTKSESNNLSPRKVAYKFYDDLVNKKDVGQPLLTYAEINLKRLQKKPNNDDLDAIKDYDEFSKDYLLAQCLDVVEQTMLKTTKRSTDQRVKYSIAGDPVEFVDSLSGGISEMFDKLRGIMLSGDDDDDETSDD